MAAETPQRYEVVDSLARGGMAEVLLARQRAGQVFERYVVLKATLPHLQDDAEFVASFYDEARLAAQLSHPNIAQIYDIAQMGGRPCIVMEWLRGRDLRAIMQRLAARGAVMDLPVLVRVLLGAASALSYAHHAKDTHGRSLGIVHRDVSPHNIFVTREGGVKLIDFGVAKSAYQMGRTEAGVLKGKLAYMAPEQARGKPVDLRSDLWSLGVVAWECATGERLFGGATPLEAWGRRHAIATTTELGEWLETLVPRGEDREVPTGVPTTDVELRSLPAAPEEPTLIGDATIREDPIRSGNVGQPRSLARPIAIAIAIVMTSTAIAVALAVLAGRGDATHEPATTPHRPGPVATERAVATITLRVDNLPEGAVVLVDGERIDGASAELASGEPHRVVIQGVDGDELYSRELVTTADVTIPVVVPEAAEPEREPQPAGRRGQRARDRRREADPGIGMRIDWNYE